MFRTATVRKAGSTLSALAMSPSFTERFSELRRKEQSGEFKDDNVGKRKLYGQVRMHQSCVEVSYGVCRRVK